MNQADLQASRTERARLLLRLLATRLQLASSSSVKAIQEEHYALPPKSHTRTFATSRHLFPRRPESTSLAEMHVAALLPLLIQLAAAFVVPTAPDATALAPPSFDLLSSPSTAPLVRKDELYNNRVLLIRHGELCRSRIV